MTGRGVFSDFWRESMTNDRPPWHVLCVNGDVHRPVAVSALDLSRFPQKQVVVTRGGVTVCWQGVDVGSLLALSGSEPEVRFAVLYSGGRRLVLSLEQVSKQNALLALRAEGRWLDGADGGPCRLVLQGSRWRDFGGPIDRIQMCVDRPTNLADPHLGSTSSSRASASAA